MSCRIQLIQQALFEYAALIYLSTFSVRFMTFTGACFYVIVILINERSGQQKTKWWTTYWVQEAQIALRLKYDHPVTSLQVRILLTGQNLTLYILIGKQHTSSDGYQTVYDILSTFLINFSVNCRNFIKLVKRYKL